MIVGAVDPGPVEGAVVDPGQLLRGLAVVAECRAVLGKLGNDVLVAGGAEVLRDATHVAAVRTTAEWKSETHIFIKKDASP